MGILRKTKKPQAPVQIRSGSSHPFGIMDSYVPLRGAEVQLYRAIREAVPVVDAAIVKLIRLTGGFQVACRDPAVERRLADFLRTVNTGRGQRGIDAFVDCYLDSLITCGKAVGEIVLRDRSGIAAVLCGDVGDVAVREGDSPLDFKLCQRMPGGEIRPFSYQELILFTPFNPESNNPYGVSLLRSMPFMADILMKIYSTVGKNWERAGNVRFAVIYKPGGDLVDRAMAQERSAVIAREWSAAMRDSANGTVRDFVAVGDVEIKAIGADNQILDSEVPVRQIVEQLVSRTGIPPFMLGLNWSSTERMSSQQADVMTSELTAIRRSITQVIQRICDLWMRLNGCVCPYEVQWDDINLQDQVEEAHAELYRAQAAKLRAELERKGENHADQ